MSVAGLAAAFARLVRAAAPRRVSTLAALAVLTGLGMLAAPQAHAQTTTVTQTAGGATWTLSGPASVQAGSRYTYTITLTSGTKPLNEYVGLFLPHSTANAAKLGLDPDDCESPKQFCASVAGATHNPSIWNNVRGHDAINVLLPGTAPHTVNTALAVVEKLRLIETELAGALSADLRAALAFARGGAAAGSR